MTSPAFGLGWHLWRRNRFFALAFLTYGAVLATSVPTVIQLHLQAFAMTASMPLAVALFVAISFFANPDADIVGKNSGYPTYLLILPVRTTELVLWPMLYCMGTVVLSWLALGHLILHPLGFTLPLWWPALILAGLGACIQAVFWLPLGLPYLRLGLLLTVILFVLALGTRGAILLAPGALVTVFLVVIAVAFLVAIVGVGRARRGDTPEWIVRTERADSVLQSQQPFPSPQQAQFWYEWSRNGLLLPLFISALLLLPFVILLTSHENVPLDLFHPWVPSDQEVTGVGGIMVRSGVKLGTMFGLLIAPIVAGSLGCGVWRADTRKPDHSLNPFYAARPLTSTALVFAKFQMAASSTLVTWGIILLFEAVLLAVPAQAGPTVAPLGLLLLPYLTLKTGLLIGLALVAGMVLTWKGQVSALFVNLAGSAWFANAYGMVQASLLGAITMLFVWINTQHPEMWSGLLRAVPTAIVCCVLLKLLIAGWALQRCRQRHLLTARDLAKIGIGWLSVALAFWVVLCRLIGSDLRQAGEILGSVLLFLPLARVALAPLAMDWNRHR